MTQHTPQLVLASTSFWRNELFHWLGLPYQVVSPDFDESAVHFTDFQEPSIFVKTLATGKCLSVAHEHPGSIVVAADTIVFFRGEVFGKPKGIDGARTMLKKLSGENHQVFTGVCVIQGEQVLTTAVESVVHIDLISDKSLEFYLSTGESLGKAGSYSITGKAKSFIHLRKGSITNVLGLPLLDVAKLLEQVNKRTPVVIEKVIEKHLGVKDCL